MKKHLLTTILLIVFTQQGWAQQERSNRNSISLELGGMAGAGLTVNYHRKFYFNKKTGLNVGIGFSRSLYVFGGFTPRLPIQSSAFYELNKHSFEVGFGIVPYVWPNTFDSIDLKDTQIALFGHSGYKYSIMKDRCYVGLAFTPIFFDNADIETSIIEGFNFFPWGALRFGYRF